MAFRDHYSALIKAVSEMDEVLSIGKSGGEKLPKQNESDIDLFVFCAQIPNASKRQNAVEKSGFAVSNVRISTTKSRFWGYCDSITVDAVELCLMYFTVSEMDSEIESVLNGSRLGREDEYFYPTGRCATLLSMHALYDGTGYLSAMKERLALYPESLAEKLFRYHVSMVNDTEDFERAVSRGDALFYHSTLDTAIDHFLQALFALNRRYFPSRKRTLQIINDFSDKPKNCAKRLLQVIKMGSKPKALSKSYAIWCALCSELSKRTEIIT